MVSLPSLLGVVEVHAEAGGPPGVLLRPLLEDGDDPRLPAAEARGDELGGEDRLARPRRPGHQQAVALGDPAAEHRVQLGDPGREPPPVAGLLRPPGEAEGAGEGLHPVGGDAERVQPRDGRLAPELHDLQLPHDRVPLDLLVQPEEPVGHGEHGVVADLPLGVLPDQEGGRLPARQVEGQPLDESLERPPRRCRPPAFRTTVRNESTTTTPGLGRLDLPDDLRQDRVQVLLQHHLAEVDEPDGGVQLGRVEEPELLLVPEHLEGRLAQHGEVQGRPRPGWRWRTPPGGRASSSRPRGPRR